MFICTVTRPELSTLGVKPFLTCLLVSLTMIAALHAEDDPGKAANMLNQLKQRSAADRWQRVKKQYPADTPAPRRNVPSPLPQDQQRSLQDDELPPLPVEGFTIPRLAALPADDSTDWIRAARPVVLDDESESAQGSAPNASVSESNADFDSTADTRTARADNQTKSDGMKEDSSDKEGGRASRTPIERAITSINPYYDRDRDSDIRKFAVEKAKEFQIDISRAGTYQERSFPEVTLAWEATNFYYYPLYFADPALERYGHSYPRVIQPLMSIARFGTQVAFIPYQMAITPPLKPEYPLGWYRTGECAPKLHYPVPLNAHAAATQAAVVTGLFFAIP